MFCEVAGRREMQEIDRYTMEEIGIPSMVLMERAALCTAEEILLREGEGVRALCVCGMGNNGGDGIAVARMLVERGQRAEVLMVGALEKQGGQCREQMEIARNLAIPVHFFSSAPGNPGTEMDFSEYTVIVDALFGIGLSRAPAGAYADAIRKINACPARVYAVDIPSGVDAETGQVPGAAVKADVTVTFGLQKKGLLLPPGYLMAGAVAVRNIGFPEQAVRRLGISTFYSPGAFDTGNDLCPGRKERQVAYPSGASGIRNEICPKPEGRFAPSWCERRKFLEALLPPRRPETNKGSYGKVLVVAGSLGMAGAALLCAEAAYRMGSGLVKVFSEESNRLVVQTRLPEAIFSSYSQNSPEEEACEKLQKELDWATAVVFGPGVGISPLSERLLLTLLSEKGERPLVLDADGLNLLAGLPDAEKFGRLGSRTVCTPHMKEMERLCGGRADIAALQAGRLSARGLLSGFSGTLVLKDARTVVLDQDRAWINTHGCNGMATGGSGDVLSGIIGGMLAAGGMDPFTGAVRGVAVHALLGGMAAARWTSNGMLAGDLVRALEDL